MFARVAGVAGGEIVDPLVGQVAVLVPTDSWKVHAAGHVPDESAVLDRHVEGQTKDPDGFVDRGGGVAPRELAHPGLDVAVRDVGELDPIPLRVDVACVPFEREGV